MSKRTYFRGTDFPHEGFVQLAIESRFAALGFTTVPAGHADFACVSPTTGESWVVEAKGKTLAIGLDFRTGLGQLLQQMNEESTRYGLALPEIPQFIAQCRKVSPWVRSRIGIHWLLVSEDGTVRIVAPDQAL